MRVLVIYCHPRPDSFAAALRDAAVDGLTSGGHTVELRDLYAEAFDPVLSARQHGAYFDETGNTHGIEDHVAALGRAEALLLIYPTWWFGMPAMLKGWFDRVWLPGAAFRLGGPKVMVPLLTNIGRIGVVTTYGMPGWMLWWVGWPDRRVVRRGLRPLCAPGCRMDWIGLTRMDVDSPARRQRFLVKVRRRLAEWG
ncbi:MAG: flavodoxin family protein [Acetobacteraceae bacterium]|nr:flavodoxin family protein [Acetobacteraceae bacterium]